MAHLRAPDPLELLLAQSEAICSRSETLLGWAHQGRQSPARKATPPVPGPAPVRTLTTRPLTTRPPTTRPHTTRPLRAVRVVDSSPANPDEVRHEADLAPAVSRFLSSHGLTVAQELCLYPTLTPDHDAIRRRMRFEGRRVTVADFWPPLLQTLSLAPAGPFRRQDLLGRLGDDPLTRSISAARLSRYLRTLRRYGYLRRVP